MINASPSYVSKVISGNIKLALEYVPVINELLQHNDAEADFFMQLVCYSQAGSNKLEVYFKNKLDAILEQRRVHPDWIDGKQLTEEVQAKYYSHWLYTVIHVLTSVPDYQTKAAIAAKLRLSINTVKQILDYLVQVGLIEFKGDRYRNLEKRVYQKKNAIWAEQANHNIRQLALHKQMEPSVGDMHYWYVMALSKKDGELIRKILEKTIEQFEPIAKNTKNEEVFGLSLDFFKV